MKQFLSLVFGILILTTCGSPKSIQDSKNTGECAEEATVRDYTGLDACRFLLELKDGTRLIPVELSDKEFLFSEGQLVKISYKKMKDVVTACLTAAEPVEISCITQIKPGEKQGQVFFKPVCSDTDAPLSVGWLNKAIIRNKANSVSRGYQENKPYFVLYGNVYGLLFDCFGELVCEYPLKEESACTARISRLSNFKSVWALK
ncbi:MAG: hypothetical protein IPL56_08145 [Saprospiraceae bacterium]|nr:hypothetical protein [Saprospiraceae bacterium]MBK8512215.1 hypothetical protein [Saprospiraceae bacterium]